MVVACVLPIETSFFNYRSSLEVINSFQVGDIKTLLQEELEVTAGTAVTLRRGPPLHSRGSCVFGAPGQSWSTSVLPD